MSNETQVSIVDIHVAIERLRDVLSRPLSEIEFRYVSKNLNDIKRAMKKREEAQ